MIRLLWLTLALAGLAMPADAARRPARRVRAVPPPIIWLQPPAPAPIPILVLVDPPAMPVLAEAPPPTVNLPDAVRTLLAAAARQNDKAAFDAVARLARATNPDNVAQIDALVAENDARRAELAAQAARARADRLANAAFLSLWKGELEGGASRVTGNSNNVGAYAAVKLSREGLRWRHALAGRFDYQRTDGATSTERANLAYQPQYKVDDRLFAFVLAQYERDRFTGIGRRVTAGGGMGYTVLSSPVAKLDLSGGPAVRNTDFITDFERGRSGTTLAGRGSLAFRLTLSPNLTLTQDAALFLESDNSNATATTAIDTKLIGRLKARFSYNMTYEANPPDGRRSLDTLSRATLVYGF